MYIIIFFSRIFVMYALFWHYTFLVLSGCSYSICIDVKCNEGM